MARIVVNGVETGEVCDKIVYIAHRSGHSGSDKIFNKYSDSGIIKSPVFNSVDFNNAEFTNNSMYNIFGEVTCNYVSNINNNIIDMSSAYRVGTSLEPILLPPLVEDISHIYQQGKYLNNTNYFNAYHCNNLSNMSWSFYWTNIIGIGKIPDSVIDMSYCFATCDKFTTIETIPNSIVNMAHCFYGCSNLPNVPDMSNCSNLQDLDDAFTYCYNLSTPPNLSNCTNLNSMYNTFASCSKLKDGPNVDNCINLSTISYCFNGCSNLVNAPVIPNSVTNMSYTFYNCSNLTGDVLIYSSNVSNVSGCFGYDNISFKDKDVYIPFTYDNGANTKTYNSFISLGYSTTNRVNGVLLKDINGGGQDVDLSDWEYINDNGNITLTKYIGNDNNVIVPYNIEGINNIYIHNESLKYNEIIESIDLSDVQWVDNNMNASFLMCNNLISISNINDNVESMAHCFGGCINLNNISEIPNGVKYFHSVFRNCHNLETAPEIPESAVVLTSAFHDCRNLTGDIIIHSENVSGAVNCFYGSNKRKDVYIPFYYQNGVRTRTYNSFRSAHYETGIGTINQAFLKDLATYQPTE